MYLQNYLPWYGPDVLSFVRGHLREEWLESASSKIHLDIYERSIDRPVVILSHGMAGYGRLLANFAWVFYNRGFSVVLPDLKGYGHNPGPRGHWKWHELVQNVLDACQWAGSKINPSVFLAGASMGGALVYHAACHGAPVKAIACCCLLSADGFWTDLSLPESIR